MFKAFAIAMEQPERGARGSRPSSWTASCLLVLVGVALIAILFNSGSYPLPAGPGFRRSACGERLFGSLCCALYLYSERVRQLEVVPVVFSSCPSPHFEQISAAIYVYKFHPREVLLVISMSVVIHVGVVEHQLCLARALIPEALRGQTSFS